MFIKGKLNKSAREITLLIVDDNSYIRSLISSILKKKEFNILTANDGREALETLRTYGNEVIDLVVTDYKMPKMNGFELIKELKISEEFQSIPIILLSQHNTAFFSQENSKELEIFDIVIHKNDIHKLLIPKIENLLGV